MKIKKDCRIFQVNKIDTKFVKKLLIKYCDEDGIMQQKKM